MLNNLLSVALNSIRRTPIQIMKYSAQTVGFGGIEQSTYSAPITVNDTIAQPVKNSDYARLGLDFQKAYFTFFVKSDAISLEDTNATPDKIIYNGKTWVVVKTKRWYPYDGWTQVIAVAEKDYSK